MFETALRYLVDSDDGTESLLIGGLLTLLSWLLVPAVLVAGYLQRILARTYAGDRAPSFDDWGDLLREGLKAIAVTLAYFALPILLLTAVLASLLIVSVENTVLDSSTVTDPSTVVEPVANVGPDLLSVVVVLGGLALAALSSLAAWYVLPAALARLAVEGRLGAAFQFRKIGAVATSGSYATGWLSALVVHLVAGGLVGGLASIPFVGWALVPFVAFYANTVAFSLYGQGYRDATPTGRGGTVDGDRRVTA
ncbi:MULTISPECIES: DUF4013 domain-containing protein [Halorussus]|uniref:DUF4013 domain-containing protein n=1 Tax=Halorussus TaxID=1070314 RepID=UPI000E20E6DA|nr:MULTISPECIES: DUF4013 domain-containing protein [Halorussus]NHN59387.1 DUF4013 domain-containing protein [Halorussus sp. JP-T4]